MLTVCSGGKVYLNPTLLIQRTGLSQRADHPKSQLKLLHGNLFDIKCSGFDCDYTEKDNYLDPLVPGLAIPTDGPQPEPGATAAQAADNLLGAMTHAIESRRELDIADASVPIPRLEEHDLPHCPKCNELLRPGIVWFSESLPPNTLREVDQWIEKEEKIDLMLVIGTSARVYPAAGYIDEARDKGARVAVINMDRGDLVPEGGALDLTDQDWFFVGDAAQVLPEIFKSVIGDI